MKTIIAIASVVGALVALERIITSKRVCISIGPVRICND
jgi:hypothetical protein